MLSGDKRALARLMTYVDNQHEDLLDVMNALDGKTGRAFYLGITGPPGAGKSTLVDKFTHYFRKQGKKVGIVAMDPSSPFTGGAVLGDRIRMQDHNADEHVFIRSLGSHGAHGGLSNATKDIVKLLDAFGFDVVLIETVGVGQTELDIMSVAHTTVVVLVPESGDTVQTMKAGLMEIADIFVVNKSDREGGDRIVMELQALTEMHGNSKWQVPVLKAVAVKNQGIEDIMAAVQKHQRATFTKKNQNMETVLTSINPATGEELGSVVCSHEGDAVHAVHQARLAQVEWANRGFKERGLFLLKIRDVLLEDMQEVAELISRENGKPVVEAIGHDIMPVMDLITYFEKNAEQILASQKIKLGKWGFLGRRSHVEFYPLGVVGIIAPWNFPLSIPLGETAMALMAGNAVLLKPSECTPLVGKKIADIIAKAGLPRDIFQLLTGDAKLGEALVKSGCDKIVFTGSTATGKKIMRACAQTLTPVTLELGGKDPFIVFEDADLDTASSAAVWGAFCNSGQSCSSIERVYVQDSVYDDFLALVLKKTKLLRQGPGMDAHTDIGPMTSLMQLEKVASSVQAAKNNGAQILVGGDRDVKLPGFFFKPTVVVGADVRDDLLCEETFGPVLPVIKFSTEQEAITLANDSHFALNAYLWGKNKSQLKRVTSQLVAGTVNLNETLFTHALPQTPWGGPKNSGLGRTHGSLGLLDLVGIRHVHENLCPNKRNSFWWYRYSPGKIKLMHSLNHMLFGRSLFSRAKSLWRFFMQFLKEKSI